MLFQPGEHFLPAGGFADRCFEIHVTDQCAGTWLFPRRRNGAATAKEDKGSLRTWRHSAFA